MKKKKILAFIIGIFLLCSAVEYVEFLFIETDKTILSENVICKLFAIIMILLVMWRLGWKWRDLGFCQKGLIQSAVLGICLGASTFFLSYLAEYLLLLSMGKAPQIQFFITNFAVKNQNITGASFMAAFICVIGNILNVWAEEGLFRGILFRIGTRAFTEKQSNLLQAFLFGIWHIVIVVVWIKDGSISIPLAAVMAVGYVILAGILAYEWGLCLLLTGTVWAGVFEHFFNNFITNSLHMVTESGIDELQILRIVLSNALSLAFVITIFHIKKRKEHNVQDKDTF